MFISRFRLLSPDPARLRAFYRETFAAQETPSGVELGGQAVDIARSESDGAVDFPANATGFQHFALVVVDIAAAYAALGARSGWRAISLAGPERLPPASGGASAFKLRDPDGHPLELLQFPADATPEYWRARFASSPDRLFHGVDHTAVTVGDAEATRGFYTQLGFAETHRQINRGPEQARLDGLPQASVEALIVSLAPASGGRPGVELLAYRTPLAIAAPAADGAPGATWTILSGDRDCALRDPDGRRLKVSNGRTARVPDRIDGI